MKWAYTCEIDTNAWSENLKEMKHLVNVGVYGRMILKCIFFAWLRVGVAVKRQ
jgi:hypothetical protein